MPPGPICRRCGHHKQEPRDRSTALCVNCEAETKCKHYQPNGLDPTCAAGMNIAELTAPEFGCGLRRPCYWIQNGEPVKCDKFEGIGIAANLERDKQTRESNRRMMLTFPLISRIRQDHNGENWKGTEPCPVCGGVLHMTHAACNGHVWGKCETPDCLAWME